MKKEIYKQCRMTKKSGDYIQTTVSYIPSKFAIVGNKLNLKEGDIWTYGWVVEYVGHSSEYFDYRKSIKSHRNNTGDSLISV
jgi:hypothetical protein